MTKRVQDARPARAKDADAWLKENVAEQKKRYAAIVKEQDELAPSARSGWRHSCRSFKPRDSTPMATRGA